VLYNYDGIAGDEILTVNAKSKRLDSYKFTTNNQDQNQDWPILFYPLESGKENMKRDLVLGDFDGDGLTDIVISRPGSAELILYRQQRRLGLAEPVRFPAFSEITSISAADIDGDKKDELAVLSVKEKAIGISQFEDERLSFPAPIDIDGDPLAMALADADVDDNIDCVYVFKDANDSRWLNVVYNVGSNTAPAVNLPSQALQLKTLEYNPDGLQVIDVDQDSLPDVLVLMQYEDPILVRQTEKGKFEVIESAKSQGSLIKAAKKSSIAIEDIDGRAGKELLIAQKNFARSLIFADGQKWTVVDQYNAKGVEDNISAVGAFDIDGDGVCEILLLDGQKGRLQMLKAGSDNIYRFQKRIDVTKWNIKKMLFAALTGNVSKSILLFDGNKFALITPVGDDGNRYLQQQFSYETKIKDGAYGHLAAGDINSDGRADVIMVEYKRNHIEILTFDTETKPIPAMRFKIFEQKSYRQNQLGGISSIEPREMRIADVTGDGKEDLVVIIHDRIIVYPQD